MLIPGARMIRSIDYACDGTHVVIIGIVLSRVHMKVSLLRRMRPNRGWPLKCRVTLHIRYDT